MAKIEFCDVKFAALVGICGKAGAGKDTFADAMEQYLTKYAFADAVKKVAAEATYLGYSDFYDRDTKEEVNSYWNKSPREIAQLVGTELFRNVFGGDFWIKRLELELINTYGDPRRVRISVSDVRFQNEAQWILDRGGILVHITRPSIDGQEVGIKGHASEAGINFMELKFPQQLNRVYKITNDKTPEELKAKAFYTLADAFPHLFRASAKQEIEGA